MFECSNINSTSGIPQSKLTHQDQIESNNNNSLF